VAYEWKHGDTPMPASVKAPNTAASAPKPGEKVLKVRKGSGHSGH